MVSLKCQHLYHASCLAAYFDSSASGNVKHCPLCRDVVDAGVVQLVKDKDRTHEIRTATGKVGQDWSSRAMKIHATVVPIRVWDEATHEVTAGPGGRVVVRVRPLESAGSSMHVTTSAPRAMGATFAW